MFNLVPFAGSRRKVAHHYAKPRAVRQFLKFHFPLAQPISVAASTIGCDQQLSDIGIQPPFATPPSPNRSNRERASVVVRPHVNESAVPSHIVDAVRIGTRHSGTGKVVAIDFLRRLALAPLSALILVIADRFLLFRVHGYDRSSGGQRLSNLLIDVIIQYSRRDRLRSRGAPLPS